MTTRIRLRRGTTADWNLVDPVLAAGELGVELFEDDTAPRVKIGDGVTAWTSLAYGGGEAHPDLAAHNLLGLTTDAELTAAVDAAVTAAVDALVTGAPAALDTFNELAAALGDDPDFAASVALALANTMKATGGGLEMVETIPASGAALTLDPAVANWFDVTLTADCSIDLDPVTADRMVTVGILLRQPAGGGMDVTWDAAIDWLGFAPTIDTTAGAITVVTVFTRDGGVTWYGAGDPGYPEVQAAGDLLIGTGSRQVARLAPPSASGRVPRSNLALPGKVEWGFSPAIHRRFQPLTEYGPDAAWTALDSLNAGRLLAVPFHASVPQAWTHISYVVQALGAGSTYRLGVYQGNGAGYPGDRLFDAGVVSGAATGAIAAVIPNGPWTNPIDWLWLAVLCEIAGATARAVAATATLLPMPSLTTTGTGGVSAWNVLGVAAGALPATFPAGGTTGIPAHKILLRSAA